MWTWPWRIICHQWLTYSILQTYKSCSVLDDIPPIFIELLWTAPEHLRESVNEHFGSQKGDVYSFAIVMQEIICRSAPYSMLELSPSEVLSKLRRPPPLCRPKASGPFTGFLFLIKLKCTSSDFPWWLLAYVKFIKRYIRREHLSGQYCYYFYYYRLL